MRYPFTTTLLFLSAFLFNTSLFANETNNNLCENTVTVSVANSWPPFSYLENGQYKGLDIEILELILKKLNKCPEYVFFSSSSRAFIEFQKGNIDIIFAASKSDARESFSVFSIPYRMENMQLFTHRDRTKEMAISSSDIIAINRGSVYGEKFELLKSHCDECFVETNLLKERLELLKRKRVDFAIVDELAGYYFIKHKHVSSYLRPTNVSIHFNPVHYMLRPGYFSPSGIEAFNNTIEASKSDISQLVEQYTNDLKG